MKKKLIILALPHIFILGIISCEKQKSAAIEKEISFTNFRVIEMGEAGDGDWRLTLQVDGKNASGTPRQIMDLDAGEDRILKNTIKSNSNPEIIIRTMVEVFIVKAQGDTWETFCESKIAVSSSTPKNDKIRCRGKTKGEIEISYKVSN